MIGLVLLTVPMRGFPGRPRNIGEGLQRDSELYDVERLIDHLGLPLVGEYGVYVWCVAFLHGDTTGYKVD
ncbi:hypothetical protein PHMEG_0003804 [Phytophthora megakarya]|uniref:Uncharacterized protein n=1 Tax=Phytophthora megakarya TaxID=4795 RepID=A0A225WV98_9STRA|nr:hypothetical protein PHMEG_0003804 [Phytophthora megakarya]